MYHLRSNIKNSSLCYNNIIQVNISKIRKTIYPTIRQLSTYA